MASTYLSRTPGSSGSRQIATLSAWIKRSNLGNNRIWSDYYDSNNWNDFYFTGGDNLEFTLVEGGSISVWVSSTAKFRDTSGWYHIVLKIDTTQATASDRVIFYVNGEQITNYSITTYPSLNQNLDLSQSSHTMYIGQNPNDSFDGSMAHVHFIDGTAYDTSAFGETDATTEIWKPKTAPSVTYGTNGFFLKFASSGSMGTDSSGNGNNFTVNGNLTQTQDTPSNVFCTMNPLEVGGGVTFSNGNNTVVVPDNKNATSTLYVSKGKYYWECKSTVTLGGMGFMAESLISSTNSNLNGTLGFLDFYGANGTLYYDTSTDGTPASWSANDIIGCAIDLDNDKIYWSINGTWIDVAAGTQDPSTGTNGISFSNQGYYTPFIASFTTNPTLHANFGNGYFGTTAVSSAQSPSDGIGIFEYAVPSGYKALCTKSINAQEYS